MREVFPSLPFPSLPFPSLPFPKGNLLYFIIFVIPFLGSLRTVKAQSSTPKRVIHLWVDPQYGSDKDNDGTVNPPPGAPWNNPRCTSGGNGCNPSTECKPNLVTLTTGEPLLHAPWPYKTINGPTGALSYIPSLPSPGTVEWTYAVIHLLPGLYARDGTYGFDSSQKSKPNPDNGLYPNGEVFPIQLPKGVSLQGTSALNTLFDVAFDPNTSIGGPAIQFGLGNATGEGSFIDSIAFFGAQSGGPSGPLARGNTAILIDEQVASKPTISNCFFMGNGIGVLINASYSSSGPIIQHDGTTFFNNTFAFNVVGLWNGQLSLPNNVASGVGVSKLVLVNNLFDTSPDSGGNLSYPRHFILRKSNAVPGNSGFEGVDRSDLQINVGNGSWLNSNAYEVAVGPARVNTGGTWGGIVGLRKPTLRRSGFSTPAPAVDIAPYTLTRGTGNRRRGVLFVRDLLAQPNFSQKDFDGSPHDFRLAPAVGLVWTPPNSSLVLTKLNPLAEAGWGGPFPMTMRNGIVTAHEPGYLPLNSSSQNTWAFHNWNWDCEGYGNPRFQSAGYFYPSATVDIGADDLAQLVIAGYRFGTTSFMKTALQTTPPINAMGNDRFWFLGPPTGMVYSGTNTVPAPFSPKPRYRTVDHLTGTPPQNYVASSPGTVYPPWFSPWSFQKTTNYYFPEVTEIVPHLLDDPHPWWTSSQTLGFSRATNPIWQKCIAQFNLGLYADPTFGRVNPPGSYKGDPTLNYQWLDLTWTITNNTPASLIKVFDWDISFRSPNSGVITKFDSWCRGYDGTSQPRFGTFPPTTPSGSSTPLALRFAVAHQFAPFSQPPNLDYTQTNLQSFLVYIEGGNQ